MKKSISLLIFCIFFLYAKSQDNTQHISLTKYTIPLHVTGAEIGKIITEKGAKTSLVRDTANIFALDKNGILRLKPNKNLTETSPFRYEITIKSGKTKKCFEVVSDNFIKNKVIAHRGAWKHHDVHQNSLGALKKAIEIGCEGSEFDVWLTKDNRVALNHDYTINGLVVEETDLSEMQKIILESGEVMTTLEEYINCIKTQNRTRLVLEIKSNKENKRAITLADSVVSIIHRMKAQAWIDYISFDYGALQRIRDLDPSACLSYLEADRTLETQKKDGMNGIDYHFSHFDKDKKLYDNARMLGLTINVWTVNEEVLMNKFLRMDVDYITTDEPRLLLKLIKQ